MKDPHKTPMAHMYCIFFETFILLTNNKERISSEKNVQVKIKIESTVEE
jgi:hypothetical protein